jgi:hypothetical protein
VFFHEFIIVLFPNFLLSFITTNNCKIMKNKLKLLSNGRQILPPLLYVVICWGISGCCIPNLITSLPVTLHPQETQNWCWAASGQMVMDYLGHNVSQCTEANNRFGRKDCCNIDLCPVPTEPPQYDLLHNCINCVCGGWPEFNKYGFSFKKTSNAPLTWKQLREQLCQKKYCRSKPFAFSWHWPGGGGHMMVVKGYLSLLGNNYVIVLDPWSPCQGDERIITYDFYNTSPGDHTHWDDYYDVTYIGGN